MEVLEIAEIEAVVDVGLEVVEVEIEVSLVNLSPEIHVRTKYQRIQWLSELWTCPVQWGSEIRTPKYGPFDHPNVLNVPYSNGSKSEPWFEFRTG